MNSGTVLGCFLYPICYFIGNTKFYGRFSMDMLAKTIINISYIQFYVHCQGYPYNISIQIWFPHFNAVCHSYLIFPFECLFVK